jgi:thioredoxin 1
MTQDINDSDFEKEVTKSSEPVLVDFWSECCGPCKMLTPVINQLAEEMKGKIKIVKMNIDENPDAPSTLGVRSIPTLMIFKDGKQVATKIGAHPKNKLEEWINSSI